MKEMINHTAIKEFLLLGFFDDPGMQTLYVLMLLMLYMAAVIGNGLIILLITFDLQLHTPMYFFLKNLSFIDLCYISVTVPKFVFNTLIHRSSISFLGCVLQVFFFVFFASAELAILTVMSYDRYAAICCPLHYGIIMNNEACGQMVMLSYISCGVNGVMHTAATFSVTFNSNKIHQFFCDIPQIILISDTKINVGEVAVTVISVSVSLACFISIAYSYVHIFTSILRISSLEGRSKALSTCIPHLVVVTFFISTASLAYLKPISHSHTVLDFLLSVFYSVVPPAMNPIIYSLRNKNMKAALERILKKEKYVSF